MTAKWLSQKNAKRSYHFDARMRKLTRGITCLVYKKNKSDSFSFIEDIINFWSRN